MKINLRPIWGWMYRFMPVEKNTAFFSSFYGQYNDNPRYVSEELHRRMPDMKIIWVCSKKNRDGFPDYVKTIEYLSKEYYKYVSCAQVVVDNHTGMRDYKVLVDKSWLKRVWYRLYTQKRKQQFCISTWHGTPLKTIGEDASRVEHYSCADYLTVAAR